MKRLDGIPPVGHQAAQGGNDAAETLRYVFIERARCPACGSAELQTIRSQDQGDGSTSRDTRCRNRGCRHRFFVIVE